VSTWKVILATIVIFAAGLVTGSVLTWRLQRALVHPQRTSRPNLAPSPGGVRFEFLRRAQRDLNLSAEQRERVDKLLKDSQERTHLIMSPVSPQLRAELQRTKEEFRDILNPQQQQRFDEMLKKSVKPREPRHAPGSSAQPRNQVLTNAP
jgi:hypothetical protein